MRFIFFPTKRALSSFKTSVFRDFPGVAPKGGHNASGEPSVVQVVPIRHPRVPLQQRLPDEAQGRLARSPEGTGGVGVD